LLHSELSDRCTGVGGRTGLGDECTGLGGDEYTGLGGDEYTGLGGDECTGETRIVLGGETRTGDDRIVFTVFFPNIADRFTRLKCLNLLSSFEPSLWVEVLFFWVRIGFSVNIGFFLGVTTASTTVSIWIGSAFFGFGKRGA
jgi:hypothetical protein